MQELMEINITRCVNSYHLMPIISIVGSKILLAFELESENEEIRINDVPAFLAAVETKHTIEINKTPHQLDYKYFSAISQKLLDLCYLNRHAMTVELEQTAINNEFMTFIYSIYKDSIYYSYNSYMKKSYLKKVFLLLKLLLMKRD